jgi:hypothetical protein
VSRKKEPQPYWRPDFRIQSTLPDIKVVRTDFIINFVALALVFVAFSSLLEREYRALSMRGAIEQMQQRIQLAEAADKHSLQLSQRFRKATQHVLELQRFYNAPLPAHDFLAELALSKPEDLIFSSVALSEVIHREKKSPARMGYQIQIKGDVPELTLLDEFKGVLQQSSLLNPKGFVSVVDERMQPRDVETRIIPFEISIALTTEKPAKADEGGKE